MVRINSLHEETYCAYGHTISRESESTGHQHSTKTCFKHRINTQVNGSTERSYHHRVQTYSTVVQTYSTTIVWTRSSGIWEQPPEEKNYAPIEELLYAPFRGPWHPRPRRGCQQQTPRHYLPTQHGNGLILVWWF